MLFAQSDAGVGIVVEDGELGPQAIHMGKRDVTRMRTAALRLSGQLATCPRGVIDQS